MTLTKRLALALGVTALVGTTLIQAAEPFQAEASIPFAFTVNGKQLEAGTYRMVRQTNGVLAVLNVDTLEEVMVVPLPARPTADERSTMTFSHYGSHYFLSKVQYGNDGKAYPIMPSKHEKEMAKVEKPELTILAMR